MNLKGHFDLNFRWSLNEHTECIEIKHFSPDTLNQKVSINKSLNMIFVISKFNSNLKSNYALL